MTMPELSRPVQVDRLIPRGSEKSIEASAEERAALAGRFRILGIDRLVAEIRLEPFAGGTMVRLKGHLEADVRQACVVSLVEVPQHVDETFELTYGPPMPESAEAIVEFDAEDPPEPIIDGIIDIGEATAEQLALALDPYPRAAGAALDEAVAGDGAAPKPFASLAAWKRQ